MWSRVFLATWTTGRLLWNAEVEDLVCKAARGVTMRDFYRQLAVSQEGSSPCITAALAGLMTLSLGVATSIGTLPACFLCSNLGPANQNVPRPGFFRHVACRAVFWRARRNSRTHAIRRVLELLWTHGSKVQARRQNTVRTAVGARLTTERLRPQEQRSISEELGGRSRCKVKNSMLLKQQAFGQSELAQILSTGIF